MFLCAALSKPHLFESRGHNRQGSDSSVDRFITRDEPAEPEPDNKVETYHASILHQERLFCRFLMFCLLSRRG